jgi:methylmalonyl-CoA mutase
MIEKELTIASDFPPVSYDKWRASVVTDLKGVPFEKKLVHRSLEGFDIQPLYTANDWPSDRDSSGFPGFLPLTRGSQALGHTTAGWDIRQEHLHPSPADANKAILEDLEHGVTSIQLRSMPPAARFDADARGRLNCAAGTV